MTQQLLWSTVSLSAMQRRVLLAMDDLPVRPGQICERIGHRSPSAIGVVLRNLEVKGLVRKEDDGRWRRTVR